MSPANTGQTSKIDIYHALRREIIMGRRQPGERLAIKELTRHYGTSVTPVRDALQMLSQEALVTIKPRAGYYVTRVTLKELQDLLDLREILETAAVARAAATIEPDQINALRKVHAGYTGDDDASYTRYTDENSRFHCLLAEASGNRELAKMVKQTHDRLARFMVIRHAGRIQQDIHAQLIAKLEAHDTDGAVEVLQKELRDTQKAIMEQVIRADAPFWALGERQEQLHEGVY